MHTSQVAHTLNMSVRTTQVPPTIDTVEKARHPVANAAQAVARGAIL